jgi:hypothetical protein
MAATVSWWHGGTVALLVILTTCQGSTCHGIPTVPLKNAFGTVARWPPRRGGLTGSKNTAPGDATGSAVKDEPERK